ncbi:hypothetical protein BDC45DRAFT_561718 [Circinella umbellata]|nr:hypothetical protein BDC45DRAFT_561718 [Circinella umbellata]
MTPLALLWSVSSKHLLSFSFTSYTLLYLLVIYILVYYAQLLGPRHWAYSRYRSVKVCNITICLRVVYFEAIYLTDFLLIFYSIVYILVQELFLSFSIIDYITLFSYQLYYDRDRVDFHHTPGKLNKASLQFVGISANLDSADFHIHYSFKIIVERITVSLITLTPKVVFFQGFFETAIIKMTKDVTKCTVIFDYEL